MAEAYTALNGQVLVSRVVQQAGTYPDPPLPSYNVQVLLRGEGTVRIRFGRHSWVGVAVPGSVIVAPPDVAASYEVDFDHECLLVSVGSAYLEALLSRAPALAESRMRLERSRPVHDPLLGGAARHLYALARRKRRDPLVEESVLVAMLYGIVAHQEPERGRGGPRRLDAPSLTRLREFVRERLPEDVSAGDLAAFLGTDRFRLVRLLRRYAGVTPHRFIVRERIELAVDLIHATRQPLAQVAVDAGFADQAHMSRWFATLLGRTPGQIRADGYRRAAQ
jgi:AraC family transcriptional regulator